MAIIEGARQRAQAPTAEGIPAGYGMNIARARYDFAIEGGAVSTIPLHTDQFPAGAIILGGYIEVVTPPVGAGASIALTVEAAGDIQAAAAITGAPWSTAGRKSVVPVFTGATSVKTTVARSLSAVISGAPLTAGVFDVVLFYVPTA